MTNVTKMPPRKDQIAEMTGPIRNGNSVLIDSKAIPNMHMHDHGDEVEFILDNRLSYSFPREWAWLAAAFAAEAMAIGAGWPSINSEARHYTQRPFAPTAIGLGALPED